MSIRIVIFTLVAYLLIGCSDTLERDVEALVSAKNLWISKAYGKDYEYTIKYEECFCKWKDKEIRVLVSDGRVEAANLVSSQALAEPINPSQFWTIKEHFEHLFSELKERANGNNRIIFEVSYDKVHGHPAAVYLDRKGVFDANVRFSISNVRIKS